MSRLIDGIALVFLVIFTEATVAVAAEPASAPSGGTAATRGSTTQSTNWMDVFDSVQKKPREAPPTDSPRLVEWVDYTGDLWQRAALTGDWAGARQDMMDKGVRFNANLTQILQGNVAGGVNKSAKYQGGMRVEGDLDTGAAGLWPGGMFHVRGETQYGKSNNADSGGIMPVNTDALYPVPNQTEVCLSEAYYMQFVAPWLGFLGGKMSPRDTNVFAHDETTQFMNTAFNFNPVIGATVPLDFLAAGAILRPTDWFMLTTLVLDREGKSNVSGFDTVFHGATTVYQNAEFTIKPFGQKGHQRIAWTWSDKSSVELRQDPRLIVRDVILERVGLGNGPNLKRRGGDWCMMYDFDQYLYTKPGTKDEGFGLFGRFGYSDGVVNPVGQFYSLGLGGKGMIPTRKNDTYGVGYYYLAVSDKIGPILDRLITDEKGVEIYYNIAVTPWLHITPDIQIIEPGRSRYSDTAVVAGIRVRIDF